MCWLRCEGQPDQLIRLWFNAFQLYVTKPKSSKYPKAEGGM